MNVTPDPYRRIVFTVAELADPDEGRVVLEAVAEDPRFRGVVWRWWGGPLVEYGLPGHPVGVVNVWDYETGTTRVPFTAGALAEHLAGVYADPEEVAAVRAEVAHGD